MPAKRMYRVTVTLELDEPVGNDLAELFDTHIYHGLVTPIVEEFDDCEWCDQRHNVADNHKVCTRCGTPLSNEEV